MITSIIITAKYHPATTYKGSSLSLTTKEHPEWRKRINLPIDYSAGSFSAQAQAFLITNGVEPETCGYVRNNEPTLIFTVSRANWQSVRDLFTPSKP